MHEATQMIIEAAAGSIGVLLSVLRQRRARRCRGQSVPSGATLDRLGVQLDIIDALVEAQQEHADGHRHGDERQRRGLKAMLHDIDELAGLADPPPGAQEDAAEFGCLPFMGVDELLGSPESPRERARVFLSTADTFNGGGASVGLEVAGNRGPRQIFIADGTSQSDIIWALQFFLDKTGVVAVQDQIDPNLIRLTSLDAGPHQFVAARQYYGHKAKMVLDQNRTNHAYSHVDFGA